MTKENFKNASKLLKTKKTSFSRAKGEVVDLVSILKERGADISKSVSTFDENEI